MKETAKTDADNRGNIVCRVFYILVSLRVLRRTPRTVAPEAYWISLRIPVHFF